MAQTSTPDSDQQLIRLRRIEIDFLYPQRLAFGIGRGSTRFEENDGFHFHSMAPVRNDEVLRSNFKWTGPIPGIGSVRRTIKARKNTSSIQLPPANAKGMTSLSTIEAFTPHPCCRCTMILSAESTALSRYYEKQEYE